MLETSHNPHSVGDGSTVDRDVIAIIGLGLMGGSLGLALRARASSSVFVTGYARREVTRDLAMQMGACDRVTADLCDAIRDANVVVLCTPIFDMPNLLEVIKPSLRSGTIITDVGSTKSMLSDGMEEMLQGSSAHFVGSHPMAGSEQTGIESANKDLYHDAVVVVTPGSNQDGAAAVENVRRLWECVGARVFGMEASVHDAIVARTSHVPHLVAAMLVRVAAKASENPGLLCGPGFRDTTRIAAGSEYVWHDIVKSNATEISCGLYAMRDDLDVLLRMIEKQDFDAVRDYLGETRTLRSQILQDHFRKESEGC